MSEFQVTCIHKPHHNSPHEHITHIGNSQSEWCLTRESAIQRIDARQDAFYTIDARTGTKVYVGVVRSESRPPYLRTFAEGQWNDNLLAQPECPANCKVVG